ncbi:MAG: winged helix-turn-helix domain-containing protein [Candidatus Njordarchaeales archaeon]
MSFRSKYRSRLEIIANILEIVKSSSKKTHIMFKANLSYRLLCQYLDEVLRAGLVHLENSSHNYYLITDKGELFLEKFYEYSIKKKDIEEQFKLIKNEKAVLEEMLKSCQ